MKKTILLSVALLMASIYVVIAQDEENPLVISGSVDTYYKYDFSGKSNSPTSFAGDQNSFSLGMANIILSKEVGNASFVADIAFGPRADQSAPGPIQNLYVSYALSDKIRVTGGFMGTFVGYEVISPVGNFNYSTSYLFSNGPFQNGGLKFDFAISEKFAIMAGIFNEFDSYTNGSGGLDFGAQVFVSPVDGLDAYINFVTSNDSGSEIDLTTTYQVSEEFMIGLNAAKRTTGEFFDEDLGDGSNFYGVALYLNYAFSDAFALGVRGETFKDEDGGVITEDLATKVNSFTLSANIGSGPLKIIPEIRFDSADEDLFEDGEGDPSDSFAQFLVAAVFSF
ncbi:MAG: porin [Cyclobacteriaceae bacterium]|nr:porin [Cyclobacteriaceae bacterium]